MSRDFTSSFAADLENMITLKVSLGYSASTYLERAINLTGIVPWNTRRQKN